MSELLIQLEEDFKSCKDEIEDFDIRIKDRLDRKNEIKEHRDFLFRKLNKIKREISFYRQLLNREEQRK
jgi:hypothetical protein